MDFANFILGRQQLARWTVLNYRDLINACSIRGTQSISPRCIFASLPSSLSFPSLQFNPSAPLSDPISDGAGDGGPHLW
jgi:hypothetical protein